MWLITLALSAAFASEADVSADPHQWLEEVESEQALEWVKGKNADSTGVITADARFDAIKADLQAILDSDDRIPYVSERNGWWYNFWTDAEHPRGLWRRTTPASYKSGEPEWEILLDLDALGKEEGVNWVYKGSSCLAPDYERCLISLSRGGADATEVREFDISTKSFLEQGFVLPEAKQRVTWIDAMTLYVGTDFGEASLTDSGYPRIVKKWTRGTDLADAETVFEGQQTDISVGAYHDHTPGYERSFVYRGITFYTNELFEHTSKGLVKIDKQDSANAQVWKDWLLIELREDWTVDGETYTAGSLLAAPYKKWLKGKKQITPLFVPDEHSSLAGFSATKSHLLLNTLVDVKSRVEVLTPGKKAWERTDMPGLPGNGTVSVSAVDADHSDAVFVNTSDFITPSTYSHRESPFAESVTLGQLPSFFDAEGMEVTQHFATSKDGTKVPYFQIGAKDAPTDGSTPTLLYGYGGFEVSLTPGYKATAGAAWIARGGTYVIANIRGGGEYGPRWHQAALKENRMRAYEDFSAVAEDLVARGVTSNDKLGIRGGSNGGLLMGNMYSLYPDQFGAVVCQVPLLDMKRYHKLLAGASWMGEYGDPDTDDWSFMKDWSPYHTVDPVGRDYPEILITTSTRDDRVHPGHARKFAAKLWEGGEDGVLYYENIEGGHGGAADNSQRAFMEALTYTFLWRTLGEQPEEVASGDE